MDRGTTTLVLANRSFLYSLLARGFAGEADRGFLELLGQAHTREELELIDHELNREIVSAYESVRAIAEGDTEEALVRIRRDYVEIFVGPGTLKARPWETIHLNEAKALFQPELLPIRDAYRQAGFLPARYPHVQDDFIGLELDFMAKLAQAALDAWQAGDEACANERLEQSRRFLNEHLLRWIDSLADAIAREYGDGFFACFARLAALVPRRDYGVLNAGSEGCSPVLCSGYASASASSSGRP